VDIETRRRKQQALMVQMVERKVRERAQQLYDERGQQDGQDLKDWFQAEYEITANTAIGQLYRRLRIEKTDKTENPPTPDFTSQDSSACETTA
jgi:hypothetical protein